MSVVKDYKKLRSHRAAKINFLWNDPEPDPETYKS
jgi:hypothetical protein